MTNIFQPCPHCSQDVGNFRHIRFCPLRPEILRSIQAVIHGTNRKLSTYLALRAPDLPGKMAIKTAGGWQRILAALDDPPTPLQEPMSPQGSMLTRPLNGWEEHAGLPVLKQYEKRIGGRMCTVSVIR